MEKVPRRTICSSGGRGLISISVQLADAGIYSVNISATAGSTVHTVHLHIRKAGERKTWNSRYRRSAVHVE